MAFLFAVPIAVLGGLIGLGGAEFRLPVLVGPLGYTARAAVPLNLAVSMATIAAAIVVRSRSLSLGPVQPYAPVLLSLIAGAVVAAYAGTALFARLDDHGLERTLLWLLLVIGAILVVEGLLPVQAIHLLPANPLAEIAAGIVFGLGIGFVSSLLGVAGGEIIIPTLVFAYGVDIKTAGTASLLISLPVVAVGIARHAQRGAYTPQALTGTVAPMSLGSVIGAIVGGLLAGIVPANLLKIGLGVILIISAWRVFRQHD